jgi:hypothetical protein
MTAAAAQAAVVINQREPFTIFEITCTGEQIVLEGTRHLLVHVTESDAGGVHVGVEFNIHGQGTSPSGARYILSTGANNNFTLAPGETVTQTVTTRTQTIRAGEAVPDDDLFFVFVFHITVNPNGEVTSEVTQGHLRCN